MLCFRSPRVLDGRMLDGVTGKQFLRIPETEICLAEPEVTSSVEILISKTVFLNWLYNYAVYTSASIRINAPLLA